MKNKIFYHLGNALIMASLISFVVIFYPLLQVYIFPPHIIETLATKGGTIITIPKINAQASVIENVDPWNKTSYNEALKHGVAHAQGTAAFGKSGTSFLFAHSSGLPWEMTRMNTIFLRLDELINGDEIFIQKKGQKYVYRVFTKKVVDPSEVQYLIDNDKNQLILQTCTPIGTSYKRLLIFAEPISN